MASGSSNACSWSRRCWSRSRASRLNFIDFYFWSRYANPVPSSWAGGLRYDRSRWRGGRSIEDGYRVASGSILDVRGFAGFPADRVVPIPADINLRTGSSGGCCRNDCAHSFLPTLLPHPDGDEIRSAGARWRGLMLTARRDTRCTCQLQCHAGKASLSLEQVRLILQYPSGFGGKSRWGPAAEGAYTMPLEDPF